MVMYYREVFSLNDSDISEGAMLSGLMTTYIFLSSSLMSLTSESSNIIHDYMCMRESGKTDFKLGVVAQW